MINAIELLRKTADECERRSKDNPDPTKRAELADISVKWHLLAGEAAKLYDHMETIQGRPGIQISAEMVGI